MALSIGVDRKTDGRWIAEVLELPGILAYGQTRREAIDRARALSLRVIADRIGHREAAPGWGVATMDRQEAPMSNSSAPIHSDPEILGGAPVFVGTRVPVRALLDHLEAGDPLAEFLDDFPGVTREQAVATLRLAGRMLVAHAHPA